LAWLSNRGYLSEWEEPGANGTGFVFMGQEGIAPPPYQGGWLWFVACGVRGGFNKPPRCLFLAVIISVIALKITAQYASGYCALRGLGVSGYNAALRGSRRHYQATA